MTELHQNTAMDDLLSAVERVYRATPALVQFSPWPSKMEKSGLAFRDKPCRSLIESFDEPGNDLTEPVVDAIRKAADLAHWTQTYTEEEVGRDFLNRYGYFEIFGPTPTAHFYTDELRGYVGYWDHSLDYGWHNHEAEEIYFCLAGEGLFKAEGEPDRSVSVGDSKYHASFQPHAMSTTSKPFLCLAFWRGDGVAELPKMAT